MRNLEKKLALGATWKKISDVRDVRDVRDLGKSQRWAQPEKEVSNGFVWPGDNVSDTRILAENQRRPWPGKIAMCSTWKRSQRRTPATWKKSQQHAQPEIKLAKGLTCEEVSVVHDLKKRSAMAETWKRSQRHAQNGTKSTTCTTCEKCQRRAQSEKEVSDGLKRPGKKPVTCATWKRSQQRTRATWKQR